MPFFLSVRSMVDAGRCERGRGRWRWAVTSWNYNRQTPDCVDHVMWFRPPAKIHYCEIGVEYENCDVWQ